MNGQQQECIVNYALFASTSDTYKKGKSRCDSSRLFYIQFDKSKFIQAYLSKDQIERDERDREPGGDGAADQRSRP